MPPIPHRRSLRLTGLKTPGGTRHSVFKWWDKMSSFYAGLDICDATQEATCNDTLGLPVYLQLMRNTTGRELRFRNGTEGIFTSRSSRTVFHNEFNTTSFRQRWQFVRDNGTLIINPVERRDAGTYRVEISEESTGKGVGKHTVQLIIEGKSLCYYIPVFNRLL